MRTKWRTLLSVFAATLALTIGALASPSFLQAQGTPESHDHGPAMDPGGHPAHIHDGTCADIGGVVYPLNNLTAEMDFEATPDLDTDLDSPATPVLDRADSMDPTSGESGHAFSSTIVDASLDDLLASPHALNVHESVENAQNFIACGDITGTPSDGALTIQLEELNGSGFSGNAILTDNGDGTTTVVAMVNSHDMATPVASPAA